MKVTGKITKVLETKEGVSKAGTEWKKTEFLLTTNEEYNNLYCFEIFGLDKVDAFLKFQKVNDIVEVDFNVKCREWQGKYFTSLEAWKVFSQKEETKQDPEPVKQEEPESDLPF